MKKDIIFPQVRSVYLAVVNEFNKVYKTYDWNAYIINDKDNELELVLVVISGYLADKMTTTFRKKIDILPAKSYAKIELIPEELFALNNQFNVTFFENNKIFDKTYLFKANTINQDCFVEIPLMDVSGILVK